MKKHIVFICIIFYSICISSAQVSYNMNLLDQWDDSGLSYNDCWGYVDGNNNEYAILGSLSKIHFFQITSNNDFVLIDEFTPGSTSVWRDFKTYGNYAYAVTEGNEGLLVYDLSNLPTSVSLSHEITSEFTRAHNIYIDELNGKLYVVGSNTQSNGLIIYDVTTNPPTHLASVSLPGGGYVHDLYVRNDTAYCSHGNNGYYIWDVSTPTSPSFLASFTGEQGYNHSSWVTPDGNTAFYAREVGVGLPMTALDISDLNDLEVLSNFKYPLLAPTHVDNVPHNPYLVGNYLYTSYYEDGVQVFDVSDPLNVTQAAYYDTYPTNTSYNGYNGCWGVYPFLPSGRILASDDINGLFLLELDISSNPPLVLNIINQTNVLCNGESSGSIEVVGTGGVPPYTYSLDGGTPQTSGIFTNLFAGTYTLSTTDAVGVVNNTPIIISEPSAIFPLITLVQNVTCFGNSDGMMTAQASGGTITSSYQYSIDGINFSPNNTFTNLTGGSYTLSVRDDNNCIATIGFNINEPDELLSFVNTLTNIDCFGNNNGEVSFFTLGGTPAYSFSINQIDFQPTANFNNLPGGNYTLYTIDAQGCQSQTPFTITEPSLLQIAIAQQTNLNCFGENIGEVTLSGQGGTQNYEYNINNGSYQSSATFSNLSAGNYDFNIKDGNGCIVNINTTITSPPELLVNISQLTNVDCFGENTGAVNIDISGGGGNYSATLNGNIQTGNTIIYQNLSAGNYLVSIEDGNGCMENLSFEITQNAEFEIFPFNIQNPSCNNTNDGIIEIFPLGGSGPFNYFINNIPSGSNPLFENLGGGVYNISAVDNLGCEATTQFELVEPNAIVVNIVSLNDVSCGGTNNGSVTLSGTGGVGVLQYILNGTINTTGIFNNLAAGNYTVIISDENDCVEGVNFTIIAPQNISAQIINQTNIDCNGNMTGTIQVTASGGNSNYIFDIGTTSNTTGLFENLGAGFYNISITDGNNCQTTISTELTEPTAITSNIVSTQAVLCSGQNNGSVQVSSSGGTGILNFTLGNETNTTGFFENLSSGNYNIQITDSNNCQSSLSAQISEPTAITSNIVSTQSVTCFGQNNGSIQVAASGGTGTLNFTLGNEANTTGFFENLSSGNYNIQITDSNNCQSSISAQIFEPTLLTITTTNIELASCNGQQGAIQVEAQGGTPPYQFSNGNTTNGNGLFENLMAGVYLINVIDNNNCSTNIEVNITEPNALNIEVLQTQHPSCFGENSGSLQLNAIGGTGTVNYSLGNENNNSGLFENLFAGFYNIIITDENNCASQIEIELVDPPLLEVAVGEIIKNNCFGDANGSISLNATGGTGALIFSMGNETNTTGVFENLSAGNYSVLVNDENNCQSTLPFSITEPPVLTANISQNISVACSGEQTGAVQFNAEGGTGNYLFSMEGVTNSTGLFENLAAGNFEMTLTDDNGCSFSQAVIISEPTPLILDFAITQTSICNGDFLELALTATGGVGNYQFSMNNETNGSGNFSNLLAGTYNAIVTDANGCTNGLSITVVEPPAISITTNQIQSVDCNGSNSGSVSLTASGGTGALQFSLNNDINFSGEFENLAAGLYQILVTDENNCSAIIEFEITEPQSLEITLAEVQPVNCNGESTGWVQVNTMGGSGNIQFSLNNETNNSGLFENLPFGNYEIIATDNNNCTSTTNVTISEPDSIMLEITNLQEVVCFGENNGSVTIAAEGGNGIFNYTLGSETNTDGVFDNLNSGTYDINVLDENNCTQLISVSISEPQLLEAVAEQIQGLDCAGDSTSTIVINGSGGKGNLQYTLNNNTNTSGVFENLPAGTYTYSIIDENNCVFNSEVIITEPMPFVTTVLQSQNINCFGEATGSIEVGVSGGTSGYTFTLDGNSNATGLFDNLLAGTYDVIINDANNCESIETITLTQPSELTLTLENIQPAGCNGAATGSFQVLATGGTGNNYAYTVNNQTTTDGLFENISAGVYDCVVTDENNCTTILQITVNENSNLVLNDLEITNIDCFGFNSGSAQILVTGGVGNLNYALDTINNSTGVFNNLPPGNYNIIVSDAANCSSIFPIEIIEPSVIEATADSIVAVDCFGASTGAVLLNATGGVGGFNYFLDGNPSTDGWFENLFGGSYSATVVDANNCSTSFTIEVFEPSELLIAINDLTNDLGNSEGSVTLSASGGTPDYLYSLDGINFQSEKVFDNLGFGNYTGYVQDLNGCVTMTSFEIEMETAISNIELGIQEIQILPNPFFEKIIIRFDLITPQDLQIELNSIDGKNILQKKSVLGRGQQNVIIDVASNVPAGVYILSIRNEEQMVGHFKIIKS